MEKFWRYVIPGIQVARPVHWVKNLSIFAALIFTGQLFNQTAVHLVILAFLAIRPLNLFYQKVSLKTKPRTNFGAGS